MHYELNLVSVPEASVHEYARMVFAEHQVRFARQALVVQSVSESMCPQPPAHHHLRLRVPASDGSHIPMSLLRGVGVHKVDDLLLYRNYHPAVLLYRPLHLPSPAILLVKQNEVVHILRRIQCEAPVLCQIALSKSLVI